MAPILACEDNMANWNITGPFRGYELSFVRSAKVGGWAE